MAHTVSHIEEVEKLLEHDPTYLRAYESSDLGCSLKFELVQSGAELEKTEIDACINLVEKTAGHDYRASSIGWNPRKKKEEMTDREMMYLLVRAADTSEQALGTEMLGKIKPERSDIGKLMGFISFMFTNDDPPYLDRDVVYIYEIHLDDHLRGRGLGSNLIQFVEHVANHCGISKTMLTVFTANKGARSLYERLGYSKDECSPKPRMTRRKVIESDYMIMSKELP